MERVMPSGYILILTFI